MTQQIQPVKTKRQIRDFLEGEDFRIQVQRAMPEGMSADRFVRIAITATIRNPDLLACTQESFFKCLMDLSAMGLEPDGRRAHLIPFKDNLKGTVICTVIVDYKGIAEMVRRHGDVASIHCDVVGKNDQFVCRYGTGGKLEHVPNLAGRGDVYAVYSYVKLCNGEEEWDVMSTADVEIIRKRSRSANKGPWVTDWNEMAKKTVFRRHSKTLPLSPQTRAAVEYDEDGEFGGYRQAIPAKVPIFKQPTIPGHAKVQTIEDELEMVDLIQTEQTEDAKVPVEASSSPQEPVSAQKTGKVPAKGSKAPESAKKSLKTDDSLFADTDDSDASRLTARLLFDGIKWDTFARWIASTGALGQKVALPFDITALKPEILADCINNYDANIEAFNRWLEKEAK